MNIKENLAYLQRIINTTGIPNVTIKRVSKTEVHTEYVQPPVQCYVKNSSKCFSSSSVFLPPNQQELLANSSNYSELKANFSPKLMIGSSSTNCCKNQCRWNWPQLSKSQKSVGPKVKREPYRSVKPSLKSKPYYAVKPTGSYIFKQHDSSKNSSVKIPDNQVENQNDQELQYFHKSVSNYPKIQIFPDISDHQSRHSPQTNSSCHTGSNHTKSVYRFTPYSTLTQISKSPKKYYQGERSFMIHSSNQSKNTLSHITEQVTPDYSTKQMIKGAPARPSLKYETHMTPDWPASTITSPDQSEDDQMAKNFSTTNSSQDSNLCEEKVSPYLWKLPTTVPGSTEQVSLLLF